MTWVSPFLAFVAGVLSILSPCVLPILPLVLASALSAHRLGPLALGCGVALSFTAIGLFVLTLGFSLGLDGDVFRTFGAVLLVALGLVLLIAPLGEAFARFATPLSNAMDARFGGKTGTGLTGQFALGLLLGVVWSPCVGPTLGVALVAAGQGHDLGLAGLAMLFYGFGAALPFLILGTLSRALVVRWRSTLISAGKGGKVALGALLLIFGVVIITGVDKALETALVDASPAWLIALTTRF